MDNLAQYYVCAVHKDRDLYEVFDKEDNTVCLLSSDEIKTLVKSGKVIDGVSKDGTITLSNQAIKFSDEYKNFLIRYNLAVLFKRKRDSTAQYVYNIIYYVIMDITDVETRDDRGSYTVIPHLSLSLYCIRLKKEIEWAYKISLSYYYEGSKRTYTIIFDCSDEFRYYLTLAVMHNDFSVCESLIKYYFRDLKCLLKFCRSPLNVVNNVDLDCNIKAELSIN